MTSNHPLAPDLDAALERVETDLRMLAEGRLFITGGTGFVGAWLLELLAWGARRLDLDLRVVALTRSPDAWTRRVPHIAGSGIVTLAEGDVRTFIFPTGEFASAVLGAASSDNAWTTAHPAEVVDTIEAGTRRGLEFAEASGVSRVLLLSSGAVYGRQPVDLAALPEDHPARPGSGDAYGMAKRAAESITGQWSGGRHAAVIARVFSVYGPYQPLHAHFAIGNFIADAVAGRPVTVRGNGLSVRSYLYGADLSVALLACLVRGSPSAAYNLGGGEPIRLVDLAALVASLASPPQAVQVLGQPGSVDRYLPDTRRIATELGFSPAVTLVEGVRRTIAWASQRFEGA